MPWFPIFGNWVKYTSSHNVAMLAIGVFAGHPYMFAKVFGRGSLSKVILYYIYITYIYIYIYIDILYYIYIDICITHYKVTPGYPSPPRGVEGVPRDDLHSKSSELLLQGTARFLALKSCGQQPFFLVDGISGDLPPKAYVYIYMCICVYVYVCTCWILKYCALTLFDVYYIHIRLIESSPLPSS